MLHLDATDPSKSERCDVTSAGDKGCAPWDGEPIAPGTLAIDVKNRQPDTAYDVKVAQTTREADPADVKAVLDEVASRLIGGIRATLASKGLGDRARLDAALDVAADAAPQATAALRDELAAPAPVPRADRATVLERYIDRSGAIPSLLTPAAARAKFGADGLYNGPAAPTAPPRTYRLGADDLAWLSAQGFATPAVTAWITAWCDTTAFSPVARADSPAAAGPVHVPRAPGRGHDSRPVFSSYCWW